MLVEIRQLPARRIANMKLGISKKYFRWFIFISAVISIFLAATFVYDSMYDTKHQQPVNACKEWTTYGVITTYSRTTVKGNIEARPDFGNILAFYSVHQNIEVYEDNDLIYKYPVKNNNFLSSTPGYCWNFVQLPKELNNIQIVITSPYKGYDRKIPTFYIGNMFSVCSYIVNDSLFQFLLCIIMFCLGLCMIGYYLVIHRRIKITDSMLSLGIFSVFLSIWSINECHVTTLILKNNIVTSYIAFLSLLILPMPFAIFVKNFYGDDSKSWDIFFKVNLAQILCCIVLQIAHIFDLRETLWSTHVIMALLIGIVFYNSYNLLHNSKNTKIVKIHLICIVVCTAGLVFDLVGYYLNSWDNNCFGRIGFLAYIIILGISSTRETASLMQMGQQADAYQRLAYTDQMTGLFNRTCFNIDFDELEKNPADIAIIDFDLNHLKYTNDTYGHTAGDRYITNSAKIISEIFSSIGKCYRVGGDEFVAIVSDSSNVDITYYLAMLESSVDACNREPENKDLRMQISFGCAVYSPDTDKTLEDTYIRADKIMYNDKKAKKGIREN